MISRRSALYSSAAAIAAPMYNRGQFALHAAGERAYSTRTLDLVQRATVIDMLGLLTLNYRKLTAWESDPARFLPADFQRLKDSGTTVFHPAVGFLSGDIYAQSVRDINGWNALIKAHPDKFQRIDAASDLRQAKQSGKLGILIGLQNSEHFRTPADVDEFHRRGQRISQLTYLANRIGGGSAGAPDTGLTPFGQQILARMNAVGMAVDISHCGDRTTLDAIDASSAPVIVTHSNCRALVPGAARCKTDEAIRRLAAKGGVIGFTMVRAFVRNAKHVTIDHVLDHIDHVAKLTAIDHVGIGTDVDLDGRDVVLSPERRFDLDGIRYADKIFDLTEGLVRRRYSDPAIEQILGANFAGALARTWPQN